MFVDCGHVKVVHVEHIDLVHGPVPFVLAVERFGMYVSALPIRLGVDDVNQVVVELFFHRRDIHTVGPVEVPHCGIPPSLHDSYHGLIVFVEDHSCLVGSGEDLPQVKSGYAFLEDGSVCSNDLCLRGGMAHCPLSLGLSVDGEAGPRSHHHGVDTGGGPLGAWASSKV